MYPTASMFAAAAAAVLSLVPAVYAFPVREIVAGQCGESDLSCASMGPGCNDQLLGASAMGIIDGLEVGSCAEAGYSVPAGATTAGSCPGQRCVDVTLYAPDGSTVCNADQMGALVGACSPFATTDADGICGSDCDTQATNMMSGSSACFVAGDMRSMLDTVSNTCAGHVSTDYACSDGLYFEAWFQDDLQGQTVADISLLTADFAWAPSVEHVEHDPNFDMENDDAFISEIDGFTESDFYIMRWRGSFTATGGGGTYGFSTTSDDGSVIFIDGNLVVDNSGIHAPETVSNTVSLSAGTHAIMIAFKENSGGALLQVMITPPGERQRVLDMVTDELTNTIGCGDDGGMLVGADDRCAMDFCENEQDCPRCAAGLSCQSADNIGCAGTCFGRCVATDVMACHTCDELSWDTGGNSVCAESDPQNMPGWSSCINEIEQAEAEEHCLSVGTRLCTAEELYENGEGQGTGCGHDNRLIWSSSTSLPTLGLYCSEFERLVIPGNMATAASHSLEPACVNVAEAGAALRCCADAVCDGQELAPNLVELAQSVPDFSTLVAAVTAGGLLPTLSGPGPFTVFAPTNEAFAALGQDYINALLADHDELVNVLSYHVVSGAVLASDLASGERVETVQGEDITIRLALFGGISSVGVDGGQGTSANVIQADVQASNGVVHVIDSVLLPPSGPPPCATCSDLGWATGSDDTCAESDDGFTCESDISFEEAHTACEAFGARLCTASELLAGEGVGTGCGHDNRYVWSTSTFDSSLNCNTHVLAVGHNTESPAVCLDPESDTAALRCCADSYCPDANPGYFDDSGCTCNGATNSAGVSGPDCQSLYLGQPHCYVNPGTCSDGVVSSQVPPNEWSFEACVDKVTVYIINAQGQCGESTFPSTWTQAALAWVGLQAGMQVQIGNCRSIGYTVPAGTTEIPDTGAPSNPIVFLYTSGGH